MTSSTVSYIGDLRTICTHTKSGSQITTDAPVDNNGKGEAFSPTDLLATSLANCMLTIMGIKSQKNNIPFEKAEASVEKIMADEPRRVSEIKIRIKMPENSYTEDQKKILEDAAHNCPVAKSIHSDIKVTTTFEYAN